MRDIINHLLPFFLGGGGFEGVDDGVEDEGLDFAAHLALRSGSNRPAFNEIVVVLLHGVHDLGNALVFQGAGFEDRNAPVGFGFVVQAAFGVEAEQHGEFGNSLVGTGLVGFADDEEVGNFEDAGLDGLDIVAHTGGGNDHDGLSGTHDLNLGLSRANGLDDDGIVTGGIQCTYHVASGGGEATQVAATGHTANEDLWVAG